MLNSLRIQSYLLALIAFVLPLSKEWLPEVILLYVVSWLIQGRFREKLEQFKSNRIAWIFIAFYIVHVVGMLYTDDLGFGGFDLEIKLSLMVFPLVLASLPRLSPHAFQGILRAFVLGCVLSVFYCLYGSYAEYQITNDIQEFFYLKFSVLQHPSYMSLYYILSLGILFYELTKEEWKQSVFRLISMLLAGLVLFGGIILLSAKSGIISLCLLLLLVLAYTLIVKRAFVKGALGVLALVLVLYTLFSYSTLARERIETAWLMISKDSSELAITSVESTTVRLIIWPEAIALFKENPILGVGTGDVKNELLKKYTEKGYTGILGRKSNAHNQYLQTAVALGSLGLLVLLVGLLLPAALSLKWKNYLYFLFLLLIMQNALTESILEVQAGVVFYAFFNSLFMFLSPQDQPLQ
ncbi:MAG: O-antigen ligase family protein [Flavobacteriales bacterium]|nr:O-antigen ligase family protein [Flavobacteriales bacterium]